jgi:hypothetical protein
MYNYYRLDNSAEDLDPYPEPDLKEITTDPDLGDPKCGPTDPDPKLCK